MAYAVEEVELDIRPRATDGVYEFLDHNGIDGLIGGSLPDPDGARRDDYSFAV